jgi:hypothetical protein
MFSPMLVITYINKSKLRWRTLYWHAFACELFAVIMMFFFYKPPSFHTKHRKDGKSRLALLKELDYVGLVLFIGGCICILVPLSWVWLSVPSPILYVVIN